MKIGNFGLTDWGIFGIVWFERRMEAWRNYFVLRNAYIVLREKRIEL